jgi:hypothetical protein
MAQQWVRHPDGTCHVATGLPSIFSARNLIFEKQGRRAARKTKRTYYNTNSSLTVSITTRTHFFHKQQHILAHTRRRRRKRNDGIFLFLHIVHHPMNKTTTKNYEHYKTKTHVQNKQKLVNKATIGSSKRFILTSTGPRSISRMNPTSGRLRREGGDNCAGPRRPIKPHACNTSHFVGEAEKAKKSDLNLLL